MLTMNVMQLIQGAPIFRYVKEWITSKLFFIFFMFKILLLIFILPISLFFPASSFPNTDFPDVPETHKNYEAITYLKTRGIINGYDDGTFKPDKTVSRVETLKVLLLGSQIIPKDKQSSFADVPRSHWGQKYIFEAQERNIVNGHADGTFRADDTVSLVAALKMLLKVNDITPDKPSSNPFTDTDINNWFLPYAVYAKEKNIIENTDVLNPSKSLTRADISELMYRLSYIQENELDVFSVTNERTVKIVSVYDGDTITTAHGEKIRIIGVNAPENGKEYDDEATELVQNLVLNKNITITVCENPRDRYGRTLASVINEEKKNIAIELLKNGLAKKYYISPCGKDTKELFENLEKQAQDNKVGIWSEKKNEESEEEENSFILGGGLVLIEAHPNAKDPDNENLNDEYLIIKNTGSESINLKGFLLHDEQNHIYTIPDITIESNDTLTIYTGKGSTTNTQYYLNLEAPIWNNSGDTLTIKDTSNTMLLQKTFKGNKKF